MLSAQERAHIAQVWDLIAGHEALFGAELLRRWVGRGLQNPWEEETRVLGLSPGWRASLSGFSQGLGSADAGGTVLPTSLLPQALHCVP